MGPQVSRRCVSARGLERNFEWEEAQSATPTGHVPPPFFRRGRWLRFRLQLPAPEFRSRRAGRIGPPELTSGSKSELCPVGSRGERDRCAAGCEVRVRIRFRARGAEIAPRVPGEWAQAAAHLRIRFAGARAMREVAGGLAWMGA